MKTYSLFVMDYVVVEAEDEEEAKSEAQAWLADLIASGEITWDVVEGDASEGEDEEDEEDGDDSDDADE
ncbi:MAG: hypothetical protein IT302_03500 [Dehalococcoidia bacterium]|nr:hypothetical protein [Dehalococcoidia bacterium]